MKLKTLKDICEVQPGQPKSNAILKEFEEELKQEAIKHIKAIQSGSGVDRTKFPDDMKGSVPKEKWNDGIFTIGIEYGFIIGLMEFLNITKKDLK